MTTEQFPKPPPLSLPREAPWRELEEAISLLTQTGQLLKATIVAMGGVPPVVVPAEGAPPTVLPVTVPAAIVQVNIPEMPPTPPAAPLELEPITSRLDITNYNMAVMSQNLYSVAALLQALQGIPSQLSGISAMLSALPTMPSVPTMPTIPTDLTQLGTLFSALLEGIYSLGAMFQNALNITTGQKNVDTAGSPEQLPDVAIPVGFKATIIAKTGNTGTIYLGTRTTAGNAFSRFDGLTAGLAVSLRVTNLNAVWIDADVDGEGVAWIIEMAVPILALPAVPTIAPAAAPTGLWLVGAFLEVS